MKKNEIVFEQDGIKISERGIPYINKELLELGECEYPIKSKRIKKKREKVLRGVKQYVDKVIEENGCPTISIRIDGKTVFSNKDK